MRKLNSNALLLPNKYSLTTYRVFVPNKKYTKSSSFQCMIMMKINFLVICFFTSVWGLLCTAQIMFIKSIQTETTDTHLSVHHRK